MNSESAGHNRRDLWICFAGLVAIALALYLNVVEFEFLKWDDDMNITANPAVVGADWKAIWTQFYYGLYIPLTYSVWAALSRIGGEPESGLFHAFNLAVHILNAFLVLKLALRSPRRGGGVLPAACAVAAACVFLVHPLQVEPVCWASGLRDLLSCSFALMAILLYLEERNFSALALFAFGLLCKPSIAVLPLILPFFRRPARARTFLPWFLFSALAIAVTWIAQRDFGAPDSLAWYWRPLVVLDSTAFYVSKTLWPFHLNVDYGRTPESVAGGGTLLLALATLTFATLALWWTKTWRFAVMTWILLLPVLGFLPFAFQYVSTVADHYMYLPMLGVALLAGHIAARARLFQAAAWIVIAMFAILAMERTSVWRNDRVFFQDILAKNPKSFQALEALAEGEERAGLIADAHEHYKRALEISPVNAAAQVGYAKTLVRLGKFADAALFVEPITSAPGKTYTPSNRPFYGQLYFCLGVSELKLQSFAKAVSALCEAAALLPGDAAVEDRLYEARQALREKTGREVEPCPSIK